MIDGPLDRFGIPSGPPDFPRTYRVSRGWQIFCCGGGGLFVAGGLAAVIASFFTDFATFAGFVFMIGLGLALALMGGAMIADTLLYQVVLTGDSIERIGLFRRRKLTRDQIQGRRLGLERNGPASLVVVPSVGRSLKLYGSIRTDDTFKSWYGSLADLDALARRAEQAEISADETLGATPQERLDRYQRGEKLGLYLFLAAKPVLLWTMFFPRPYLFAVAFAAAMPFIEWVVWAMIDRRSIRSGSNLLMLLFIPGIALLIRAVFDAQLLDWTSALIAALAISLALALPVALGMGVRVRRLAGRAVVLLILAFLVFPYALGSTALADLLFDREPGELHWSTIMDKSVSTGKVTEWHLRIAPWGKLAEPMRVSISRQFYDVAVPGQIVCVDLRSGALQIPWYTVSYCPRGAHALP
jgi:hypothetical protein